MNTLEALSGKDNEINRHCSMVKDGCGQRKRNVANHWIRTIPTQIGPSLYCSGWPIRTARYSSEFFQTFP